MKFEVTNPKAWKAVNEKNIPMSHKIKIYEKLGGAYRLGESGGEQVFNKMTELLKHKVEEGDGEDHEVSMGQNQLDSIIKYANELKQHLGEDEKEIPAWIQDHISKSQNYISQAASNYHEYGQKESLTEAKKYDIGSGWMGNGLTIWNRAEEQHGDYKIIAHISKDGNLSIRDKKLPNDIKQMFQMWADTMKKGDRPGTY
jgi:hypothetical protein